MGYSARGRKESDTTELLHFHFLRLNDTNLMGRKPFNMQPGCNRVLSSVLL